MKVKRINNFDFIIGFKGISSPKGRIIPNKKFTSYFPLRNAKNAYKTSALDNKKESPNRSLLGSTNNAFQFNILFYSY